MNSKYQSFNSPAVILSFTFLILSTLSFIASEFLFIFMESGNNLYVSIFFMAFTVVSSIFIVFMLLKSEKKFFLYVLFALPIIIFCVIRLVDIIQPFGNILLFVILAVSTVLIVMFLLTTVFITQEGSIKASEKKREKIVTTVLDSQDRYREALEKKKTKLEEALEDAD